MKINIIIILFNKYIFTLKLIKIVFTDKTKYENNFVEFHIF